MQGSWGFQGVRGLGVGSYSLSSLILHAQLMFEFVEFARSVQLATQLLSNGGFQKAQSLPKTRFQIVKARTLNLTKPPSLQEFRA